MLLVAPCFLHTLSSPFFEEGASVMRESNFFFFLYVIMLADGVATS